MEEARLRIQEEAGRESAPTKEHPTTTAKNTGEQERVTETKSHFKRPMPPEKWTTERATTKAPKPGKNARDQAGQQATLAEATEEAGSMEGSTANIQARPGSLSMLSKTRTGQSE